MKVLRPEEVAERWDCSPRFVYRLLHEGKLPAFRLSGRLFRVPLEALEAFEACHLIHPFGSSSSEAGITQLGENAEKLVEPLFAPKIVRLPSKDYATLPNNTKLPTGRKP